MFILYSWRRRRRLPRWLFVSWRTNSTLMAPSASQNTDAATFFSPAEWQPLDCLELGEFGCFGRIPAYFVRGEKLKSSYHCPSLWIPAIFLLLYVAENVKQRSLNMDFVPFCQTSGYPVCKYSVIKKDGLNFLYFLNYTRYVNDLHNIWKRRS